MLLVIPYAAAQFYSPSTEKKKSFFVLWNSMSYTAC